jgi:hypothetical protein
LLSLAYGKYTADEVKQALAMASGSREIKFKYILFDKSETAGMEINPAAVECSITHDATAKVKRTAKFTIKSKTEFDTTNKRIQPYFCLKMPDGGWAEWPLGIFLLASPKRISQTDMIIKEIEAYDKSQILLEDKFTSVYTVYAGTSYVSAIASIINSAGIGNVRITASSLTVPTTLEFEVGYSKLDAVNDLLAAINYNSLYFDAYGYAVAEPYAEPVMRTAEFEYKTDSISIIKDGASEILDIFNAPNVFVRYTSKADSGTLYSKYTITDASNPLSTTVRGRNVVDIAKVDDIADQATLNAYVRRVAIKAMQVYGTVEFETAIMPHHGNLDCLYIQHDGLGVETNVIEQAWSMELAAGGTMTHKCAKAVALK